MPSLGSLKFPTAITEKIHNVMLSYAIDFNNEFYSNTIIGTIVGLVSLLV